MNITNLNTLSIVIFLIFLSLSIFLLYRSYNDFKKTNDKIFFSAIVFLVISFFISSIWIFSIKILKNEDSKMLWTNVVFVLDVSKSMIAIDNNTKNSLSRLVLSKKFISDFVIQNPQNKYALVVFAWESTRVLPFTNDTSLFLTILGWIDQNNVWVQWTNLVSSIWEWLRNFSWENNSWIMVLISDWEDEKSIDLNTLKWDNIKNIKTLVVWVWSLKWAFIPTWIDVFWRTTYKVYNWQKVITKLEEQNLKKIAVEFNWEYVNIDDEWKIDKVNNLLKTGAKKVFFSKIENYIDATRYFVYISFIFFIFYLFLLLRVWRK